MWELADFGSEKREYPSGKHSGLYRETDGKRGEQKKLE